MQKFIHNVALLACLVALTAGLWQDWALGTTLKRMLISYLGFYGVGFLLSFAVLAVPAGDRRSRSTGPQKRKFQEPLR